MVAFLLAALLGCGSAPDRVVTNEVVDVACGTCIYKMPEGRGCYWAITLDGQHYAMAGVEPADHDPHGPDGMCNMGRKARITGELRGQNFIASAFELLPAEGVPAAPEHDHTDVHGPDYRAK